MNLILIGEMRSLEIEKHTDFNCVWKETGKNLDFQLSNEPEYSSLKLDNNKKIKKIIQLK